jgi:Flp pilus assembly protein TadB
MKSNRSILEIQAEEQLRQERDAFDQHKRTAERSFFVGQVIVVTSVLILLGILGLAIWVVSHPDRYQPSMVTAAGVAVFGATLSAMLYVWKITVNPDWNKPVKPITGAPTPTDEK